MAAVALLAAIAAGGGVLGALVVGGGDPRRTTEVRIALDRPGRPVPPSFLGLSVEWDSVLPYTGPAARRRAALLHVLAPVARAAGSPLALRIGGDTSDQAWWNPGHRPRPPTVLQDVGPATLDAIAWLTRGLGAPVTLGLNLALRDPANARALVRAARRRLPAGALAALEIGNEPDLYTHGHTFVRGGHVHRRLTKDPHYDVARYARDTARYLDVLAGPGAPPLIVGGFAGGAWWPALPRLLDGWGHRAGGLAAHLYALSQCDAPTPSASWLMSPAASRDRVATLAPLLAIARRERLPVRVAELNSAACGGRPGLSDTPAAALWTTDTLFAILAAGARGADLHTWRGAVYAPFAASGAHVRPRPPLAGMLAFARAAPAGSRLVGTRVEGDDGLRAWATAGPRGAVRLALLAPRRAQVHVDAGRATGCAALWRFPPAWRAPRRTCPRHGRYALALPAASVAVLRLAPPGGDPSR